MPILADCEPRAYKVPVRARYGLRLMARYLSKSDFKVAQTCPTKLYYKKSGYPSLDDEDEYLMLLAEGGYMVEKIGEVAFPRGTRDWFDGPSEAAAQDTLRALAAANMTLFEATRSAVKNSRGWTS